MSNVNSPLKIMLVLDYLFLLFENVDSDKFMNMENWTCLYDISDCWQSQE